jgi:hypothetical protein
MPIIPILGRLKQEDLEFEASVDYIMRLCLKFFFVLLLLLELGFELRASYLPGRYSTTFAQADFKP